MLAHPLFTTTYKTNDVQLNFGTHFFPLLHSKKINSSNLVEGYGSPSKVVNVIPTPKINYLSKR